MTDTVRDNPDRNRFELATPAGTAFASYRRDDYTVSIMHTEVPRALEGRGVGSKLVAGTLDHIRAEGRKVVPLCSFVRYFINTHPDYADLVK
ncbi:MAG: GNAT family N-acetyltransferase [Pseudolabrys sp.]|nr:GNAT family N-acetyltransferase [Pseudolabrys sp.]